MHDRSKIRIITGLYEHKKTTAITEKKMYQTFLLISIRQEKLKVNLPHVHIYPYNCLCIETRRTVEIELKEGEVYIALWTKNAIIGMIP